MTNHKNEMNEEYNTFWDHLSELRTLLLKTIFIVLGCTVGAFFFYKEILLFITPQQHVVKNALQVQELHYKRIYNPGEAGIFYTLAENEHIPTHMENEFGMIPKTLLIASKQHIDISYIPQSKLVALTPIEGMITSFKLSFWVGLVISSPFWIYFFIQFITPALNPGEKKLLLPFLGLALLFLVFGALFAYFVTIPIANEYLNAFNSEIAINLWSLASYVDYVITLLIANAFAFELAAILLMLVHFDLLSADQLTSKRRHMIVAAFILGAIFTPPDVLSQVMLALPLMGLYELIVLYAKYRKKQPATSMA